ncbi:hypothetical protein QCA50_011956 [Cerrena zonata]|uniref:Uncharacterized protein n=1 Tax=Cerrena zonata TaxID=2478898 RepID=A0AAW0FW41_9APHY
MSNTNQPIFVLVFEKISQDFIYRGGGVTERSKDAAAHIASRFASTTVYHYDMYKMPKSHPLSKILELEDAYDEISENGVEWPWLHIDTPLPWIGVLPRSDRCVLLVYVKKRIITILDDGIRGTSQIGVAENTDGFSIISLLFRTGSKPKALYKIEPLEYEDIENARDGWDRFARNLDPTVDRAIVLLAGTPPDVTLVRAKSFPETDDADKSTPQQQLVEVPVYSVGPEQTTSASLPEIDEEFGGSASRKRPRLSGSPTRIADPSWPRLLHSMEEDILMHRNTFAIHAFLWKNKDHWDQIIDTVEVDIPDLASSVTVSDDPTSSTSVKARFIKLDHVPGLNYNIKSWPSMPRFLIREEYVELEHFVELGKRLGLVDTLLLGQPGIGKSMYLTYCLLRRLAAGKSTILSLSPKARYVFLDQGVYWIPDHSVLSLQQDLNSDSDGLILYDINNEQDRAMDTSKFLTRWDSILASSPSEHRFKAWEKFNIQTSRKFVMKTWGWSEVYLSRDASKIQRGLDEWRRAFTNFGGSVRRLFHNVDNVIEQKIDMTVQLIDGNQLRILLSDAVGFLQFD